MKIVIVHYRFFISGGPERYLFNIMNALDKNGHTVIPFSVSHNKNESSDYSGYFLSPVGSGNEVYGHEYSKGLGTISKVLGRMLYSFEAKKKFKRLLQTEKPDIVYVLQFQNKMSCSVIDAAYELGIPIVQRISDFGHICINNTFYTNNAICEKCLVGSGLNAVVGRCFNNSLFNSFIKALALKIQRIRKTQDKISSYIIPSTFTASKFKEYGIASEKIHHVPTFFANSQEEAGIVYENFFLYVGRIEEEKGVLTLVKAFVGTDYKLVIVGFSSSGYDDILKDFIKDKKHNISFTGKLDFNQIKQYLKSCLCTICPSEWYDNFPNVVLESFAYKKAVIASELGSLTELVEHEQTGMLFKPGDHSELRRSLDSFIVAPDSAVIMGNNAYNKLQSEYSMELHYSRIMNVFEAAVY